MKMPIICDCCGDRFEFESGTLVVRDDGDKLCLGKCCMETFLAVMLAHPEKTPIGVLLAATRSRVGN